MAQPFRNGSEAVYRPPGWPELAIRYASDRIEVIGCGAFRVISSAFFGGGLREAERFVNRKVPLAYDSSSPPDEMRAYLASVGCDADRTVGMMTAAKLTHAAISEEAAADYRLAVVTTAGTRNAAKAGTARETFPPRRPGTINTLVFLDGALTDGAMVNAVMTATEAKAAALADLGVRDEFAPAWTATGTTTDAFLLAATDKSRGGAQHEYAGTASALGNAIGRLVYETVAEAVKTQHEP